MAEDDGKGSGRSRFKSKWGKILKNSDQSKTNVGESFASRKPKDANSQEDVADFLKPSIERAAANRPRLDVSIAQRWPEPNEVRQADDFPPDGSQNVNGWRKRRRKEGLVVGFVKTVPEVIGHGGDETMDPPSDIALHKARAHRAAPGPKPVVPGEISNKPPNHIDGPFIPPVAERSDHATSTIPTKHPQGPPIQVDEPPPPPRIGIRRAPTAYSAQDEDWSPISDYDNVPSLPTAQTSLDARITEHATVADTTQRLKVSPTPRDLNSLVHKKEHGMKADEGMALRRASAMIEPLEFEAGDDLDISLAGYAAATAAYRADVAATPPSSAVDRPPVIPPVDTPSPQSIASPNSPSSTLR